MLTQCGSSRSHAKATMTHLVALGAVGAHQRGQRPQRRGRLLRDGHAQPQAAVHEGLVGVGHHRALAPGSEQRGGQLYTSIVSSIMTWEQQVGSKPQHMHASQLDGNSRVLTPP